MTERPSGKHLADTHFFQPSADWAVEYKAGIGQSALSDWDRRKRKARRVLTSGVPVFFIPEASIHSSLIERKPLDVMAGYQFA
jgi:hypothetical protein